MEGEDDPARRDQGSTLDSSSGRGALAADPAGHLHPKSYKACVMCQRRKTRCAKPDDGGLQCHQCQRDKIPCTFEAKRRRYDTSARSKKKQEKSGGLSDSHEDFQVPPSTASPLSDNAARAPEQKSLQAFNVGSSADALLFLSDAELVNPKSGHSIPQGTPNSNPSGFSEDVQHGQESSRHTIIEGLQTSMEHPTQDGINGASRSSWVDEEMLDRVSNFRSSLIRESCLLPQEALELISFFFKNLYPFFPFVPDFYYERITSPAPDPESFRSLFEEDEILLGSLITASSRYYHLPRTIGGYERSREIHNRCWKWTKKHLSKIIFDGIRPKSLLPVVEALLVLAEWLPKSIHAFVEQSEPPKARVAGYPMRSQRSMNEVILQPGFRTDHVAWSYVGNAFLLLRSLSASRRIDPVFQNRSRYLIDLFSCLIMSQSLARRLGRASLMRFEDVDLEQISAAFDERHERIANSARDRAIGQGLSMGSSNQFHASFVELMKLLSHAQDVLHPPTGDEIVQTKKDTIESGSWLLALFQHFDKMNQDWKTKHMSVMDVSAQGMSSLARVMLEVDFEYLRLYEFSSSLGACLKQGRGTTKRATNFGFDRNLHQPLNIPGSNDWEFPLTSLAYYLEQAISAAETILGLMLTFCSPTTEKSLRYASSRHYMKIVFAAVFLLQVMKQGIPTADYQEILIATLKDTTSTLESCSIDDAHPAFRYSILLRSYLNQVERMEQPSIVSPYTLTIGARQPRHPCLEIGRRIQMPNTLPMQDRQVDEVYHLNVNPVISANVGASSGEQFWPRLTTYHHSQVAADSGSSTFESDFLNLSWENPFGFLDDEAYLSTLISTTLSGTERRDEGQWGS